MKQFLRILLLLMCLGLSGQTTAIPILSLNPHTSVIPGQNFFIDVNVSGLQSGGTNSLLGAFSIDLLFDPNLLQFLPISSSFGSALGDIDLGEAILGGSLTSPGVFNFFEVSSLEDSFGNCILCTGPYLEDLQGDSFNLATLAFYSPPDAITSGPTTIFSTANVLLSDAFGDEIISVGTPSVTVNVSEPPMVLLVVIGLALLGYNNREPVIKIETNKIVNRNESYAFLTIPGNSLLNIILGNKNRNYVPAFYPDLIYLRPNFTWVTIFVITALFVLCPESIFAATNPITFSSPVSYDIGAYAHDPEVKDINGDTKPDIIVPGYGVVEVFIGNGNGTFQPKVISPDQYGYGPLAIGDLNGDGKQDIVRAIDSLSASSNVVHVMLGQGDGTFKLPVEYNSDTGSFQRSITLGDVNSDGKLDIVVPNYGFNSMQTEVRNTVNVLLGNGDGTFKPAVHYQSGGDGPWFVDVVDFNGDGASDIVTQNVGDHTLSILLGNGDGTFQSGYLTAYSEPGNYLDNVTIGDINGDGIIDVISTHGGVPSSVGVQVANQDGTFSIKKQYASMYGPNALEIGDINGDGFPDIAVSGEEKTVGILNGRGDSTFGEILNFPSGNSNPVSVKTVDLNNDGKLDIITRNVDNTISLIFNTTIFPNVSNSYSNVSYLTFNGVARKLDTLIKLTPDNNGVAGSAFLPLPFSISPNSVFHTHFTFQIGGANLDSEQGSDGFAFVIQNDPRGASAVGNAGEGLGLGFNDTAGNPVNAISPSVAIEFDTHQNRFPLRNSSDPDGNHVALIKNGEVYNHLAYDTPNFSLNDGLPKYVWIDYVGVSKRLDVFLSTVDTKPVAPAISTTLELAAAVGNNAYFGFSSGTGEGYNSHGIQAWKLDFLSSPSVGDLNGDSCVDQSDLSALIAVITGTGAKPLVYDLNGDGKVNIVDSRKLVTLFTNPKGAACF